MEPAAGGGEGRIAEGAASVSLNGEDSAAGPGEKPGEGVAEELAKVGVGSARCFRSTSDGLIVTAAIDA